MSRAVSRLDLASVGPALRRHRAFGAAGANVDLVEPLGRGSFALRTFERGVEAETLACGTGAVAAAVVLETLGLGRLPARFRTRGGHALVVQREAGELWLEGPARIVFTGEVVL